MKSTKECIKWWKLRGFTLFGIFFRPADKVNIRFSYIVSNEAQEIYNSVQKEKVEMLEELEE